MEFDGNFETIKNPVGRPFGELLNYESVFFHYTSSGQQVARTSIILALLGRYLHK